MRRRVLNVLTAVSLLLCVAVMTLWARSYQSWDSIRYYRITPVAGGVRATTIDIAAVRGATVVMRMTATAKAFQPIAEGWTLHAEESPQAFQPFVLKGFGIRWTYTHDPPNDTFAAVSVPLWLPALLLAVPPALWVGRRLRTRPPGHCQRCGYDLRATPGRCPECGNEASAAR